MVFDISKKIPVTFNFFLWPLQYFQGNHESLFQLIFPQKSFWNSVQSFLMHSQRRDAEMHLLASQCLTELENCRMAGIEATLWCGDMLWCLSKLDQNKRHFTLQLACSLNVNIVRNFPTKPVAGNVPMYCLMIVLIIRHRWLNASEMLHCMCAVLNLLMFRVIWWCATLKEWCVLLSR